MPIAKLADVELHYDLSGPDHAPVLIFSNGLGTDLHMWDAQLPAFTASHRVLRYDTRGHGKSSITPGPYSIAQLGRDVLHLMDYLHISHATFCGLSMGGMTGMFLGALPDMRFERLILCNTAAKLGTAEVWNARIRAVEAGGMQAVVPSVIDRWFTPEFRTQHPEAVSPVQKALESTNPQGYVANCAAVRDGDFVGELPRISSKTLVIAGTQDPVLPISDANAVAQRVPGAKFLELPAAHISNIEAGAEFNRAVLQFLQS